MDPLARPGSAFPGHSVSIDRQLPQQQGSSEFGELVRRLGLNLTSLANRLRDLFASPSAVVTEKTVTILAGATTGAVEHGLGRAYRGGVITSQSGAGATYVLLPTSASITNASTTVTVGVLVAPGADLTVNLWIY
jgi:hypothetical protein